ncbi:MAG: hypothetical protein ACT4NP_18785 [Pseudonocardiales bacterium]
MVSREEPALFVIVGHTPGGELVVPALSARAAAQVARRHTEHCPDTQATWQANPHGLSGPVVVFGSAQPVAGQHPLDQDAHVFLLAPGRRCGQCGWHCAGT